MNKRVLIALLIGLNVFLLLALVFAAYQPPSAFAQAVGARRGEYLLFSTTAEVGSDAVYLLDAGTRQIHWFRSTYPHPAGTPIAVAYRGSRDLARDFAAGAPGGRP